MSGGDVHWWRDKQVAVRVEHRVVRAWVMTTRRYDNGRPDDVIGELTLVPLISDPVAAANYPGAFTVRIRSGGPHGHPAGVVGLWPEDDTTDVHPDSKPTENDAAIPSTDATGRQPKS